LGGLRVGKKPTTRGQNWLQKFSRRYITKGTSLPYPCPSDKGEPCIGHKKRRGSELQVCESGGKRTVQFYSKGSGKNDPLNLLEKRIAQKRLGRHGKKREGETAL